MIAIDPPGHAGIRHIVSLPQRYALPVIHRCTFIGVHISTACCDFADYPPEMRSQRRRRFGNRLTDLDIPYIVEFEGEIHTDAGQANQLVGRNNPEPSPRNHKATAAINVEAMSGLDTFPTAGSLEVFWLQTRGVRKH